MSALERIRVRYQLVDEAEGFVMSRGPRADGNAEYLVTSPCSGPVARYRLDPARLSPPRHMLMPKKS
ncbi:MAG: hypothetical protein ACREUG_12730 [Steroidobacteraceae bacterium]